MTHIEEVKKFGLTLSFVLPLLFGLFIPFLFGEEYPFWPWLISWACASIILIRPEFLRLPYAVLTLLGDTLGKATTVFFLSLLFYLLITPMAGIMRLFGRDPMQRKYDDTKDSYRVSEPFNSSMKDLF